VSPETVCLGETITFTIDGVIDNGGIKRVFCTAKTKIPAVTPTYEWRITKPDGTTVPPAGGPPASGAVASVLADLPGAYSCTFTAKADRECPPDDVTVGPATGMTLEHPFPEIELRYKTFIAAEAFNGGTNPYTWDYYSGDNRSFGHTANPSRSFQSYRLTLDPAVATGMVGVPVEVFFQSNGYNHEPPSDVDVVPCTPVCPGFTFGGWCLAPTATAECQDTASEGDGWNKLVPFPTRFYDFLAA
jgi:hypothetical protein